jgi:organic hydroperoxide reductase OsmC/OhrA
MTGANTSVSDKANNVDLRKIMESKFQFQKDSGHHHVEKVIQGVYNLDGAPMFQAEVQTDHTRFTLASDEPAILGGLGVHTSPFTYVLFGTIACYANTLALVCAENHISLKTLKVKGRVNYDIGPLLTQFDWPLVSQLTLEIEADRDIADMIRIAREKCPSVYAWSHPIKTEIVQVSTIQPPPLQQTVK